MGKKLGRWILLAGMGLLALLLLASPVLAIANPTSTTIQAVKVFDNTFEEDDWLIFVRYDVDYGVDPDEPATETFLVVMYDTDGSTLLYQRALNYYGLNIISIYLTPAQASVLTWGSAYVIKVMGNPTVFGALTEGVNMATKTLEESANYVSGADTDESRENLGVYCLGTAALLEDDPAWPALLTASELLNTAGAIAFNDAVPGLYSICSSIYSTATAPPVAPTTSRTVGLVGTIAGAPFTAGEAVVGGTTGATGTFIAGSETGTSVQVTHTTIDMYRTGEIATGALSGAAITITTVLKGQLEISRYGIAGNRLRDALNNFGAWLGMSGDAFGGMALFLFFAITAGLVFTATGSVHGGILVAIPVILLGNFIGLMSFAITWILVVIIALLFAVLFIMGRLA